MHDLPVVDVFVEWKTRRAAARQQCSVVAAEGAKGRLEVNESTVRRDSLKKRKSTHCRVVTVYLRSSLAASYLRPASCRSSLLPRVLSKHAAASAHLCGLVDLLGARLLSICRSSFRPTPSGPHSSFHVRQSRRRNEGALRRTQLDPCPRRGGQDLFLVLLRPLKEPALLRRLPLRHRIQIDGTAVHSPWFFVHFTWTIEIYGDRIQDRLVVSLQTEQECSVLRWDS